MRPMSRCLLGLATGAAALAPVSGYSVQPMIYTLTPGGSGATIRLSVANSREGLLNVEVEPYAVTADDAGKRTFTPAPDDFLIFPPQASIAGDKTQLFQIRYVGQAALERGRVYVLRVHQTNTTDMTKVDPAATAQARLGVSVNFNTTAIVQPKALAPALVVERDLAPDATGVLHARLVNRGTGVANLARYDWALDRGGKPDRLETQDVKFGDAVFLEPGRSRDVTLSDKIKTPARLVLREAGDGDGGKQS